jgi:GT2 family glycosyltransferase
MKNLQLQNLVLSGGDAPAERELYFRARGKWRESQENHAIILDEGTIVKLDTYFNGFSLSKWRHYTRVGKVKVRLAVEGCFRIRVMSVESGVHQVMRREHEVREVEFSRRDDVILDIPDMDQGMAYVELTSQGSGATLYGGGFFSEETGNSDPVKIGIIICTYHREDFVRGNLEAVDRMFLEYPEIKDHFRILIVDNGRTLDPLKLDNDWTRVYANKNAGGSGGFTRGLLELLDRGHEGFSHALLMDDDIQLETESLFRTLRFLGFLKTRYREVFIGGSMLRLDKKNILVESGAKWRGGELISLKKNLDMTSVADLLFNEVDEGPEYNAWWYCALPMSVVNRSNLPLPLFIRGDDIEYGLRNKGEVVTLNGIGVWHEVFENKFGSYLEYYIVRNLLINNALHYSDYNRRRFLKFLYRRVFRMILAYRYLEADLVLRGVVDFHRGLDWLKTAEPETLHQRLVESGYRVQMMEALDPGLVRGGFDEPQQAMESSAERWVRILSFNGLILRSHRNTAVPIVGYHIRDFYRSKRVLNYDTSKKKGFVTEKSYFKTFKTLVGLFSVTVRVLFKYHPVRKNYQARRGELMNDLFWRSYLDLEG